MNPHEFESRLQRTPMKQPPAEWRNEILVAARSSADASHTCSAELDSAVPQTCNLPDVRAIESVHHAAEAQPNAIRRYGRVQLCATTKAEPASSLFGMLTVAWQGRLRELFWPHPIAWGVIAVLWVAIGAVHLAIREPAQPTTPVHIATSSDAPTLMSMQRELLASWDEPADRPRTTPVRSIPPQSCIERRRLTAAA
jgi:hypothetical protein